MKRSTLLLLLIVISASIFSQNISEKNPVDTVRSNNIDIVIYDDYSWEYINSKFADDLFNLQNLKTFDTVSVFNDFWDNDNIKAYKKDTVSVSDTILVALIDSLHPNFIIPKEGRVNYRFGPRGVRFHYGLDVSLDTGDTLKSAFDGKVRYVGYDKGGYGRIVIVRHFNGLETYYAHMSKQLVKENQYVKAGGALGLGGNTGRSFGSHLHFEIRYRGNAINPDEIVNYEASSLKSDFLIVNPSLFGYIAKLKNPVYYKIRSGDTLSGIAQRNRTSVSNICSVNGVSRNTVLQIGKIIRLR